MAHHSQRPFKRLSDIVLERDEWTCQMPRCLYPTRAIRRQPRRRMDPESASVDLIHPKSLGGSDTDINNCRAAHLGCNSARGNGTRGQHANQQRYTTSAPAVRAHRG
jgi:hypothetical protein